MTPLEPGLKYVVTTKHEFEGRYLHTETMPNGSAVHVFESGSKGKGGLPNLRKVPTRQWLAAKEVVDSGHERSG